VSSSKERSGHFSNRLMSGTVSSRYKADGAVSTAKKSKMSVSTTAG
jgi:hypothetical protein